MKKIFVLIVMMFFVTGCDEFDFDFDFDIPNFNDGNQKPNEDDEEPGDDDQQKPNDKLEIIIDDLELNKSDLMELIALINTSDDLLLESNEIKLVLSTIINGNIQGFPLNTEVNYEVYLDIDNRYLEMIIELEELNFHVIIYEEDGVIYQYYIDHVSKQIIIDTDEAMTDMFVSMLDHSALISFGYNEENIDELNESMLVTKLDDNHFQTKFSFFSALEHELNFDQLEGLFDDYEVELDEIKDFYIIVDYIFDLENNIVEIIIVLDDVDINNYFKYSSTSKTTFDFTAVIDWFNLENPEYEIVE